jgi:hypothetical protein
MLCTNKFNIDLERNAHILLKLVQACGSQFLSGGSREAFQSDQRGFGHHRRPIMTDSPTALILDLLEWIAARPRTYAEVMEAWRTSCPRLTIWEDVNDRGYVVRRPAHGAEPLVEVTALGRSFLEQSGRARN